MPQRRRRPRHVSSQASDMLSSIASRSKPSSAESSGGKPVSACHLPLNWSSPCEAINVPDNRGSNPAMTRESSECVIALAALAAQDLGQSRRTSTGRLRFAIAARSARVVAARLRRFLRLLRRFGLGQNGGDRRPLHPHPNALGDLDLNLVLVDDLGDRPDDAAAGGDAIAAAKRGEHFLVLLHLLLLWANQQEVEDDEDQDDRKKLQHRVGSAGRRRRILRKRGRDEHRLLLVGPAVRENATIAAGARLANRNGLDLNE